MKVNRCMMDIDTVARAQLRRLISKPLNRIYSLSIFPILNIEQGISNDEVFFPFDIHYSVLGVLRFSVD